MCKSLKERFWSRVEIPRKPDGSLDHNACWLWNGNDVDRDGYGRISDGGEKKRAHRVALELSGIDPGIVVMHRCDEPRCCNPSHLLPNKTQTANMKDKVRKDRQAKGSRNGRAKLTEENVREIRRSVATGTTQAHLARQYDLDKSTISDIVRRRIWKHVSD